MLYIIGAIGYSIYLFFNPDKGRPSGWYWPDFINEWIGMPKTFLVATSNIAIGTDILDQIINVASANDCMSNCNNNKDCIGFVYHASSNTCNTFSIISAISPLAIDDSNVYIVDGNIPKGFVMNMNVSQNLMSNIAPYVTNDILMTDCFANCASNVTCTGFTAVQVQGQGKMTCALQTDPTFGTSLTSMPNTMSFTMNLKLPSSDNGYIT
jgi:hypothetical protein